MLHTKARDIQQQLNGESILQALVGFIQIPTWDARQKHTESPRANTVFLIIQLHNSLAKFSWIICGRMLCKGLRAHTNSRLAVAFRTKRFRYISAQNTRAYVSVSTYNTFNAYTYSPIPSTRSVQRHIFIRTRARCSRTRYRARQPCLIVLPISHLRFAPVRVSRTICAQE